MSKLTGKGWLDQCSHCGTWHPRVDLVRRLTRAEFLEGSNYFLYSSYNSSGWTCTADDTGKISLGANAGTWMRISMAASPTAADPVTLMKGTQTWQGTGTMSHDTSVDCSDWSYARFGFRAGYYQEEEDFGVTVAAFASNGATIYPISSIAMTGAGRYGGVLDISTVAASDRSALDFYITFTCPTATTQWWVDQFQLEKNVTNQTSLGNLIVTNGIAVDRDAQAKTIQVIACKDCRDKYNPELQNDFNRGTESTEPEIPEELIISHEH